MDLKGLSRETECSRCYSFERKQHIGIRKDGARLLGKQISNEECHVLSLGFATNIPLQIS